MRARRMPTRLAASCCGSSGQDAARAAVVGPVDTGAVGPIDGVLVVVPSMVRVPVTVGAGSPPLDVHAAATRASAAVAATRNRAARMHPTLTGAG